MFKHYNQSKKIRKSLFICELYNFFLSSDSLRYAIIEIIDSFLHSLILRRSVETKVIF